MNLGSVADIMIQNISTVQTSGAMLIIYLIDSTMVKAWCGSLPVPGKIKFTVLGVFKGDFMASIRSSLH